MAAVLGSVLGSVGRTKVSKVSEAVRVVKYQHTYREVAGRTGNGKFMGEGWWLDQDFYMFQGNNNKKGKWKGWEGRYVVTSSENPISELTLS